MVRAYPTDYLNDTKDFYIVISEEVKLYSRQPSSIVDAISRLGGILAIVNFTFIISLVNKRQFEKEMT